MLELWQLTGEEKLRASAERLIDVVITQLSDADAGAAADIIRTYRKVTGNDRYEAPLLGAFHDLAPHHIGELSMEVLQRRAARPSGIGKRNDMFLWYEDGLARRHNPILLSVVAELLGDESIAIRAVDMARAMFMLSWEAFPVPVELDHGCSAGSVGAVARGHGRDNNAGVITAVLEPLTNKVNPLLHSE